MNQQNTDEQFMRHAFFLARKGIGLASPNPLVGALVVRDGIIVGEGFHRFAEKKHAEVWALEGAGNAAREATLYLNLEPCCHQGRTPPCTDQLIRSGIRRLVAAMTDPNPLVAGQGFQLLRQSGIEVEVGLLEPEALKLNEVFRKYIRGQIPFVTLKAGMTLDGKIAGSRGPARRITGEASWERVHEMRHASDALLVGINTILKDNPMLTDRSGRPRRRPLLRVVLDGRLQCPLESHLVQSRPEGDIILFCGGEHSLQRKKDLEARGIEVVPFLSATGDVPLPFVLEQLGQRQIASVMVEGGGHTHFGFLKNSCADKIVFFIAPRILGGLEPMPVVAGAGFQDLDGSLPLSFDCVERVGEDLMIEAYVQNAEPRSSRKSPDLAGPESNGKKD
jgi:diaminohydroxyphosphoribosylaminopyrimidine deaminase / 5-amino-6-(5-phosphoribosylamino)uracil reductase